MKKTSANPLQGDNVNHRNKTKYCISKFVEVNQTVFDLNSITVFEFTSVNSYFTFPQPFNFWILFHLCKEPICISHQIEIEILAMCFNEKLLFAPNRSNLRGSNFSSGSIHCLKAAWVISTGLVLTLLIYLFTSPDLSVTNGKKKNKLDNAASILPAFVGSLCFLKNMTQKEIETPLFSKE